MVKDINVLPDNLINKIAAGEVVERPASVVKELVENSLDAGAKQVQVEIKDGGKSFVKVSDDGRGMTREDALLSVQRHATSKIISESDLFSISSLGFRGEALASIASVSKLSLTTRRKDSTKAFFIKLNAGSIEDEKIVGHKEGTEIIVEDLFFNTPARKKHLYSATAEFSHVINIMQRYALVHENKGFKLINNGKVVFASNPAETGKANIANIYGVNTAKHMITVDYADDLFQVKGYVSKPAMTRATKDQQSFYINKRYVKNRTINQALYDAFHTLLFLDRNPVAIINIELDPSMVDVNVHPTKEIVRIDHEDSLYKSVFNAIKNSLEENNLITEADTGKAFSYKVETLKPAKSRYPVKTDSQSVLKQDDVESEKLLKELENDYSREDSVESKESVKQGLLSPFRYLGQFNMTYLLLETAYGLVIVDQHAAEERVNYEKFMAKYKNDNIKKQKLMKPRVLEFSLKDKSVLLSNKNILSGLGFELDEYGSNTFLLRTIPSIFGRYYDELLHDIINEISVSKKDLDTAKEERIIRMACRQSIKAGQELTRDYVSDLINKLENTEKPYTCPHGRPIMITMSVQQLEKQFKRVA